MPHPIVHHPLSYNVGPLAFTGFGLAVLMAFVVAQLVAQRELARRGHDPEPIADMIFGAVIGGLLGAKLYYVIILGNHGALFTRGGFVFWGGLIGGTLAVMAVARYKKFPLVRKDTSGITRAQLAAEFNCFSDDDVITRAAFVQALKR